MGASKKQRFLVLGALATVFVGLVVGALWSSGQKRTASGRASAPRVEQGAPLPTGSLGRAELVAEADRLSVQAGRELPGQSAILSSRAAALREAAYLLDGRPVDALEAQELWGDADLHASSVGGEDGCDRALRLLRLRSHLAPDPARLYRDLYVLRLRETGELACTQRIDRALAALEAVRPSDSVLAALRDQGGEGAQKDAKQQAQSTAGPQVIVPALEAGLNRPTEITKIEPFSAERTARVVVRVTHPTRFSVGMVGGRGGKSPRLYVDIQHATFRGPDVYEGKQLVERVRLGAHEDSTRVVLDLRQAVHHRVFYLPDPFRLVIDLSVESPDELTKPREIRRVVLDPGHGGTDPGAVGPNGLREKDVTLDIAHRAAPILAREVGVSTLLTRDVDVYVPLDERAARANAFHADLFISIHLNSSPDPSSRGVMTFVLDSSRDEAAAQVAARENASTAAAAAELANVLSRVESRDRRAASELFAQLLQRAAGVSLGQVYPHIEDHGVRRAGFYVLAGASMPAVLFEGSFISHPVESQWLDSEKYRQRLADSIVNAVRAYREGK